MHRDRSSERMRDSTGPWISLHGFLYDRGTFTTLDVPFPGVFRTEAHGINSRRQIVGTYFDDSGGHSFIFDKGIFTPLDVSFLEQRIPKRSVSTSGAAGWGRYTAGNVYHGFLYTHGEFSIIDVPFPEAVSTSLSGINDKGQIVIYWRKIVLINLVHFSMRRACSGQSRCPFQTPVTLVPGALIVGGRLPEAISIQRVMGIFGIILAGSSSRSMYRYQRLHGQWASGINSRGEVIGPIL